ncbi:RIO1 family-domain-containing protein [Kalaharituber pfeilii]|nr:RIO1 family-domain-containing protein [Kalaharituber pfeilii]
MKLDTTHLRYLSTDDWRVLTAVEQGSRNHEVVPTPLIQQLASIHGSISRSISILAKAGLIAKVKNAHYDGYRLTYGGLDYLSLNTLIKRKTVFSISQTPLGVGKESDVYVVATPPGSGLTESTTTPSTLRTSTSTFPFTSSTNRNTSDEGAEQAVLKIHRLGRISFRSVKRSRDYLRNNRLPKSSWMQLSRLSAQREASFMTALYDHGFPVPKLISQTRHTVLMTLHRAPPLRNLQACPDIPGLWAKLVELIIRLAHAGLVHGDFNEFNILCYENTTDIVLIDFPQMVSVDHPNAREMWERDLTGLVRWFERRWGWVVDQSTLPNWEKDVLKVVTKRVALQKQKKKKGEAVTPMEEEGPVRLDALVDASGVNKKQLKELEKYLKTQREKEVDEDGGENKDDKEEEGERDSDEEDDEGDKEDGEEDDDDERSSPEEQDDIIEGVKTLDLTKDKIEMVQL